VAIDVNLHLASAFESLGGVEAGLVIAGCLPCQYVELGDGGDLYGEFDSTMVGNRGPQGRSRGAQRQTGQHGEFVRERCLTMIQTFEHGSVTGCCFGRCIGEPCCGIVEYFRRKQGAQ
jgi:hypothetical protein